MATVFDTPPMSDKLVRLLGEPSLAYDIPRQHQHRILRSAMTVTKGVFNKPSTSRIPLRVDSPSLPPAVERRRVVRKSTSVPSLKIQNASAGAGPSSSHTPFEDLYPPLPSFRAKPPSLSPKGVTKSKKESKQPSTRGRRIPHISSPSLPKAFDCIDFTSNPKLAHPLSTIPAPVPATPTRQAAAAAAPGTPPVPSPARGSTPDDGADFLDATSGGIRLVRRRTKSASGVKLGKRAPFMPGLAIPNSDDHDDSSVDKDDSSMVIDISSPSIHSSASGYPSSLSAGALGSTKSYFPETSPVIDIASPKSFTSVKRKPVPRYLYTDPPGHDASAPTTPTLTMTPSINSPPAQLPPTLPLLPTPSFLQTPLLPSSELIIKSCNPPRPSERGLSLLPIGQDGIASARRRHRRSVSANAIDQLLPSPTKSLGLPSPWYTANANGSMTALVTPAEEQPVFSFAHDLPAPPRISLHLPPQTPPRAIFEATSSSYATSTSSQDMSASSVSTSKGTMSPLTDDEIDAIRNFLDHNVTGARAQQRRKVATAAVVLPHEGRSRSASNVSAAYDMHAQIFDAYASEEEEFHSFAESEEETTVPMPRKQLTAISTQSGASPAMEQPESYFDIETPVMRQDEDEVATPMDMVNRGTFGYYHPLIRQPLFEDDASDVGDRSVEDRDWKPSDAEKNESEAPSAVDMAEFGTPGHLDDTEDRRTSTHRSSSVYYTVRSSSNYASQEEDADLAYLRSSREALISRFSMSSDSESERPVSSSSASGSISTTRSFNPRPFVGGFSGGIGLAILPPEQIAYFEKFDRLQPYSPSVQADAGDESPDTILHATPKTMQQRRFEMKNYTALERMRDEFEGSGSGGCSGSPPCDLTSTHGSPIQFATQYQATLLRPALHINARLAASCSPRTVLPSPTDTISTYPPRTLRDVPIRGHAGQKRAAEHAKTKSQACNNASTSADESLRDNLKSFMNLTPTGREMGRVGGSTDASVAGAGKKGKVRLRQLFSRTNLRGQAKKDAELR